MIGRKTLFSGVAPWALGLLLANITASAPAQAVACTGAVNAANSTKCTGGTTGAQLTYVDSNPEYVNGDFTLTLNNHDVTAGGIVFSGVVDGDGTIVVQNGSEVTNAAGDGIEASNTAGGAITVSTFDAVVRGSDDGIGASTTGAGTIVITNVGFITGADAAIDAVSETGDIQITNLAFIETVTGDDDDLAIRTAGGATTIDNGALIRGRIETGDGADVLNNNNVWITGGANDFGGGIDVVNSNNNFGIVAADDVGEADITIFVGLETLNNAADIFLNDQETGDGSKIIDRLQTDGDYVGLGEASLLVDAFLGGADSVSDVVVVVGNTSGVTRIFVNNTSLGPGALNTAGILVVDVGGTTDADDFVLANGPIDTGFFIYDLIFNDVDNQFLLVSEVGNEAFETLATVASSQEIWRETADAWAARQQALRDRLSFGPIVTAVADPPLSGNIAPENGLWFFALGSWTARNSEIAGFDLSYDQSIYGFVAGADFGVDLGNDGTLMFGVLAGYVDSSLNFDASPTSIKTDGATLGVYASLVDGGFFANVLVQADLLNQTFSPPSLGADSSDDADVVSIGARADLGYRFDMDGLLIEPVLSLDAMSTSIDEFSVGGADIDAGSNESFRGGAGLRLGLAGERATASLTGRIWNVFATDNEVVFTAEDTLLDLSDDSLEGVYGEVSGQVDVDLSETTVLFAKGGLLFSEDVTKPSVSGGFNFSW